MKLVNTVKTFVRDEEGQDLIEYALLVALISLVCVVALTDAGKQVNNIFDVHQEQADDRRGRCAVSATGKGRPGGRPLT